MAFQLPKSMKALQYQQTEKYDIVDIPLPKLRDDEIMIKVKACGVCGTALHLHEGEFMAQFPVVPGMDPIQPFIYSQIFTIMGHEVVGTVAALGPKATGFEIGERVVADNAEPCGYCFYCRRGLELFCDNFQAHGVTMNGGFAEYCSYKAGKVFKIQNLNDIDATLIEPASCAAHGIDQIAPAMGSSVLVFGSGPTGLVLAQMLRQTGGCRVVIVAPEGLKMDLAQSLDAGDEYITLSRQDSSPQYAKIRSDNPHGFDIVVEAAGSIKILENSINYVRRGGKLVVYGVYSGKARVSWPPSKIFGDQISIISSFSEMNKFPDAISYVDSGKVKVHGIVNRVFRIEQWAECMNSIRNKSAIKAAIVFD